MFWSTFFTNCGTASLVYQVLSNQDEVPYSRTENHTPGEDRICDFVIKSLTLPQLNYWTWKMAVIKYCSFNMIAQNMQTEWQTMKTLMRLLLKEVWSGSVLFDGKIWDGSIQFARTWTSKGNGLTLRVFGCIYAGNIATSYHLLIHSEHAQFFFWCYFETIICFILIKKNLANVGICKTIDLH